MNYIKILLFIFLVHPLVAQHYTSVVEVPDPKKNGNGYVANPDGILSPQTALELNQLLENIELQDTFQVALVCLNSIGKNVPKDFASSLFNFWGVGRSDKDNGILILFVLDQRRIEIETGYGTEYILSDIECTQLIDDYMIAYFKSGNYDQGLISGIKGLQDHLSGKKVNSFQQHSIEMRDADFPTAVPFYQRPSFWMLVLGWHFIFILSFIIALIFIRFQNDPYKKYGTIRYFRLTVYFFVFPVVYPFFHELVKKLKDRYRTMIRFSHKTGAIMHKIGEDEEDKYLSSGQITEEIVRSVDYDVWLEESGNDSLILAYRPLFSGYSKCPKCSYSTYIKEYDKQLIAPTTSSSGRGERKHSCKHCKYELIQPYTIPRIHRSSTTTTMRPWSGGGSHGWSGGGSWGGGRSGGGGGGRSW